MAQLILRHRSRIAHHGLMAPLRRRAMVGHGAELAQLVELAADAREGRGSVVVVSGEAGAGKSRVTAEFADGIGDSDLVLVGHGVGLAEGDVPLGVWRNRCATMRSRRWPIRPSHRHDRQPKNVRRAALPRHGRRRIGHPARRMLSEGLRTHAAESRRSRVPASWQTTTPTNQQVSTQIGSPSARLRAEFRRVFATDARSLPDSTAANRRQPNPSGNARRRGVADPE